MKSSRPIFAPRSRGSSTFLRPRLSVAVSRHPLINGTEVPVVSIQPNLESNVRISERYCTEINEALNTSEDRESCYPRAQYDIGYETLTLSAQETAYMRTVFELAQDLPAFCPIWTDGVALTDPAVDGDTELVTEVVHDFRFTMVRFLLIWRSFDVWEVVLIDEVSEDGLTITLARPINNDWAADGKTKVYPLCLGFLQAPASTNLTDAYATIAINFEERTFHGVGGNLGGRSGDGDLNDPPPQEVGPGSMTSGFFAYEMTSPPVLVAVFDKCNAEAVLSWKSMEGVDEYVIVSAPPGSPPPFPPSARFYCTELGTDDIQVVANNDFVPGDDLWVIARTHDGREIGSNRITVPTPELEKPTFSLTNTITSPLPVPPSGKHSDNPNLIPEGYVAKPAERLEYDIAGGLSTVPTITHPDPDVALKFTQDGSEPTADTVNPSGDVKDMEFGGVIKARAFSADGCKSPLLIIPVDKRKVITAEMDILNVSGSATGSCRHDSFITVNQDGACVVFPNEFGDSCSVFGGEAAYDAGIAAAAAASIGTTPFIPVDRNVYEVSGDTSGSTGGTPDPGAPYPTAPPTCGDQFGGGYHTIGITMRKYAGVLFSAVESYEDVPGTVRATLETDISGVPISNQLDQEDINQSLADQLADQINSQIPTDNSLGSFVVDSAAILLSAVAPTV